MHQVYSLLILGMHTARYCWPLAVYSIWNQCTGMCHMGVHNVCVRVLHVPLLASAGMLHCSVGPLNMECLCVCVCCHITAHCILLEKRYEPLYVYEFNNYGHKGWKFLVVKAARVCELVGHAFKVPKAQYHPCLAHALLCWARQPCANMHTFFPAHCLQESGDSETISLDELWKATSSNVKCWQTWHNSRSKLAGFVKFNDPKAF